MLTFKEKENLIYKLHPVAMVSYVFVILLLSLMFNHPAYLLGLFIAVGLVILSSGNYREWKGYLKMTMRLIVMIMVLNVIIINHGATALYSGPTLPVIGHFKITLEALAFGMGMGIRLLVMTSAFCLYTYAIHPDKALKLFSKWGNKSVLMITLSTRLFPLMLADYKRITEVQKCRGVKLTNIKWKDRVRNTLPIVSVLLLSSLERSFQLAESMQARGYGSGKRSAYSHNYLRPRDVILIITSLLALIAGVWALFNNWTHYDYYPRIQPFVIKELWAAVIITCIMGFPAILNWGWKRCKTLRLKI